MKNKYALILRLALIAFVASIGSVFAQSTTTDDSNITPQEIAARQANLRAYFHEREKNMHVVMTRTLPDGEVTDFTPIDTTVPEPQRTPPPAWTYAPPTTDPWGKPIPPHPREPLTWLEKNPALQGPAGTVPAAHFDIEQYLASVKIPAKDANHMFVPPHAPLIITKEGTSSYFYHVEPVINDAAAGYPPNTNGGFASLNLWKTTGVVNNGDHILAELAVISRYTANNWQTIEVGQTQDPNLNSGNDNPCLFVFFTTHNYGGLGDNIEGFDPQYKGFVRKSQILYPGVQLGPLSVAGGAQQECNYQVNLIPGVEWDVYLAGILIGEYPVSIFNHGVNGLADGAFQVLSWGEVSEAVDASANGMGSGTSSVYGWQYAAYIRNTGFIYTDNSYWCWAQPDYLASIVTDPNCYSITGPYFGAPGGWYNYFYYGGPGSGYFLCKP